MATSNRGGNRGGSRTGDRTRSGRNHNPEGRNQYSGVMTTARENPLAAAAAVGGAVAAGVFLWSRRNQISEQIGSLADQISEWRDSMVSGEEGASQEGLPGSSDNGSRDGMTQEQISEEALTLKTIGESG